MEPIRPMEQTFGERLRFIRRRRGMTQADLAEKLGCTIQTIVRYEGLRTEELPARKRKAIAEALRVEEWELTGEGRPEGDGPDGEEDIRILTRGLRQIEPEKRKKFIEAMMAYIQRNGEDAGPRTDGADGWLPGEISPGELKEDGDEWKPE